jgi:hypothetical protein
MAAKLTALGFSFEDSSALIEDDLSFINSLSGHKPLFSNIDTVNSTALIKEPALQGDFDDGSFVDP